LLRCASVRDGIYRAFEFRSAALRSTGYVTHPARGTRHTPVRPPMYRDRHINYHRRAQRRGGRPTAARARTPSPARRRCI